MLSSIPHLHYACMRNHRHSQRSQPWSCKPLDDGCTDFILSTKIPFLDYLYSRPPDLSRQRYIKTTFHQRSSTIITGRDGSTQSITREDVKTVRIIIPNIIKTFVNGVCWLYFKGQRKHHLITLVTSSHSHLSCIPSITLVASSHSHA